MNKKIILAIPISVLAVACAQQPVVGCLTIDFQDQCQPAGQMVTINVASASGLTVAPPNVCAQARTDVNFQITPANTNVMVAIGPKDPLADPWLKGVSNPPVNSFTVSIPATVSAGTDHDYHIVATNGACYDPRIRVP